MSSFTEADLSGLSIKELKSLIASAGLSSADCFEKSELVARAFQAKQTLENKPVRGPSSNASSASVATREVVLSGYPCKIVGHADCVETTGQAVPDLVVTVLHGLGATNDDFVELGRVVCKHQSFSGKKVLFCFPQAPSSPDMHGMAAWWKLDLMYWMQAMMSGEAGIAKLIRETPPGLPECRQGLTKLLNELRTSVARGVDSKRMVLGGFSQGAMTAMDLAMSLPKTDAVGATLMMSGAPIVVEEWAQSLKNKHSGHRVMVTHGRADATLPFQVSTWTHQLLKDNGAQVTYVPHSGGHDLGPPSVVSNIIEFLAEVA